jgi:hypothetical protein
MPSASSDGHTPLQFPNAKTKIWPQVTAGCELQVPPRSDRGRSSAGVNPHGLGRREAGHTGGIARPACLWLEIQAASLDRLMSSAAEELFALGENSVKLLIGENLKSHASSALFRFARLASDDFIVCKTLAADDRFGLAPRLLGRLWQG